DEDLFTSGVDVHIGLDLSQNRDLTAAVLAARHPDTGVMHLKCFAFTPIVGLRERAKQDRVPYETWVKQGHLIALPGRIISYAMVCQYLKMQLTGMRIAGLHFDRWRISQFKMDAAAEGFLQDLPEDQWYSVGQGFRDMSPRVEFFETLLLEEKLAHGDNPLLNMAAANAVVALDPAKNRKLEKAKSSARIDPMVAAVMATGGFYEKPEE